MTNFTTITKRKYTSSFLTKKVWFGPSISFLDHVFKKQKRKCVHVSAHFYWLHLQHYIGHLLTWLILRFYQRKGKNKWKQGRELSSLSLYTFLSFFFLMWVGEGKYNSPKNEHSELLQSSSISENRYYTLIPAIFYRQTTIILTFSYMPLLFFFFFFPIQKL